MDHTKNSEKNHDKRHLTTFFSDFSAKIDFYLNSHFFFGPPDAPQNSPFQIVEGHSFLMQDDDDYCLILTLLSCCMKSQ